MPVRLTTPGSGHRPTPLVARAGEVRALLAPGLDPALAASWLADPAALAPDATGPRWHGPSADGRWFVKRRRGRSGRRALERSLRVGLHLEAHGLRAGRALAVLRRPAPGGGEHTWLVSGLLAGEDLDRALAAADEAGRAELSRRVGRLVAALHAAGVRQRDLKAPNVLVDVGTPTLVDLEGMAVRHGGLGRRLRAKDLGRLAASYLALGLAGGPAEEPERGAPPPAGSALGLLGAAYLERLAELAPAERVDDPDAWLGLVLGHGRAKVARNARRGRVLR